MVARPGKYQASFNAGELAPELHGNTGLKQYYAGLARALNVEPIPQGGGRLSPRTRHLGRIRRSLAAVTPVSSTFDLATSGAAKVIATITFADVQHINVVRLGNISTLPALPAIIQIEWFDGAAWSAFGTPLKSSTNITTRTAALPPGAAVAATAIRARVITAPPAVTAYGLDALIAYVEGPTPPTVTRVKPFTFSRDQSYTAVLTQAHIDFYRDGVWVGSAISNIGEALIGQLKVVQRFDTMLLFTTETQQLSVLRDGADDQWATSFVALDNMPLVDLGGTYTNAVVDVWEVHLRFPTVDTSRNQFGANLQVVINVNGEQSVGVGTGPLTGGSVDWAAFAIAVKAAVEGIASVAPGLTIVNDTSNVEDGLMTMAIEFFGDGNIGQPFALAALVVNSSEASATAAHTQIGKPGGESLMNDTNGWPATALFYQERLIYAGMKAKRGALLASVSGEYFDVNTGITAADGAFLVNLDTDGAERIINLVRSKYLVIMTSDAEYFVSDRALTRTAPPNIVNSSRIGSADNIPVVESEGSIIFMSRENTLLYAATYDDISQSFVPTPISLLASHIAQNATDMAIQRSASASDAARLWIPRGDGTMTLGILIRNQDVTAFTRWETDGFVAAACVDGKNVPHALVYRSTSGAVDCYLERMELGLIFDATVSQTFGAPTQVITGLAMHEGKEVWAQADGYVVGPFTVTSGQITIDDPATVVDVGRWTPPSAVTLPLPSEVAERVVLRRPKRVHTVRTDLINTTSLAIGANGQPAKDRPLYFAGQPTDAPPPPFTGMDVCSGLVGFSDTGQVEITQLKPGWLQWRGITIEART